MLRLVEKFGKSLGSFKGQVVWIVGASSGIGECLAYIFVANGAKVVLSSRREEKLHKVKSQCLTIGKKVHISDDDVMVLAMDVTETSHHKQHLDRVLTHFGQVDILINNAGRLQLAHWLNIDVKVDRQLFENNVFGLLNLTRVVLPHFLAKKSGKIATTSSVGGKFGAPFSATYNATKHALHGYFETARAEFASQGVAFTMLCPGPVFSDILRECTTGEYGKNLGGSFKENDNRMATMRCAHLCAVAIANGLDEVWLALNPVLLCCYASQYCPSLLRTYFARFAARQALRLRPAF